jgi:hypothetical protein
MTESTKYAQIFGLNLSSVITREASSSDGGDISLSENSLPGWTKCSLQESGRNATTYTGECKSKDADDIRDVISEFNNAEADCEFYPFDSDRCIYAAHSQARYSEITGVVDGTNLIHAQFKVTAREPFCYGPRQGITFQIDAELPSRSDDITNAGNEDNTINYVCMSGAYNGLYTKNVKMTVNNSEIVLIGQMMAHDLFELGRQGEIIHSYRLNFDRTYETMQSDLHGEDFCYGGSIDDDVLIVEDGAVMFPFYGPLPVADTPPPKMEFFLISGDPHLWRACASDLSDAEQCETIIRPGWNTIEVPDCDGRSFVSFGLQGTFEISSLYAEVHRYVADSELPKIAVGDVFTISISDGDFSNHALNSLIADYRDKFWW